MSKSTDINFQKVPLSALRSDSLLILRQLDRKMILQSENKEFRDCRGVIKYADFDERLKSTLKIGDLNIQAVLNVWTAQRSSSNNNLHDFLEILKKIDRYDIFDDCLEFFEKDAVQFAESAKQMVVRDGKKTEDLITSDDLKSFSLGQKFVMYDAFILYAEEDEQFVIKLFDFLTANNVKFVSRNNFIGGITFEHNASMRLIEKRCRKVIIVVSNAFLQSSANTFLSNYTQHIGIQQDRGKMIPCVLEECNMPTHLYIIFPLKYYRMSAYFNFWAKLYESIITKPDELRDLENSGYEYNTVTGTPILPETEPAVKPPVAPPRKALNSLQNTSKASADVVKLIDDLPSPPSSEPTEEISIEINEKKKKAKKKNWFKDIKGIMKPKKNETKA